MDNKEILLNMGIDKGDINNILEVYEKCHLYISLEYLGRVFLENRTDADNLMSLKESIQFDVQHAKVSEERKLHNISFTAQQKKLPKWMKK